MLYISHREKNTKVLGPGLRYAIWLQGCKKHCAGCINPAGRPLDKNGYFVSVEDLFEEIKTKPNLTGITVSGGEPFLQAEELSKLILKIKSETNLDIMIYSGYTLEELRNFNSVAVEKILSNVDLLIDGEYIEEKNNNTIYRGSDNQVIHFLSDKYLPFKEKIENTCNRSVEFVCRDNDELFIVGLPAKGFSKSFFKKILEDKNER